MAIISSFPPDIPRLDPSCSAANKHMESAQLAATRGVNATDRTQLIDAINSARYFLQAAADELKPPPTRISLY